LKLDKNVKQLFWLWTHNQRELSRVGVNTSVT